jgi:branched-chain amino acid transport system substrate-binding protein
MTIGRHQRLIWGLLVAAMLAGAPEASAEIMVGFAGPLTGQMEYAGEQAQNGAELAIAELNAAGGVLGQQVVLDSADDYCDPEQAVAAARQLLAHKVVFVTGHWCSGAAIPASEIYEAARIPFITGGPTNPRLTERGLRFTFRSTMRYEAQATLAIDYMVRQLNAHRIAIVHDTRIFGKELAELTSRRLAELGAPARLLEAVQPGQLEYLDLIDRLRRAQIEVLYYAGYSREAALLRRQMAEAGFLPPMIAGSGAGSEDYGLIAGSAAEGTLITRTRAIDTPERVEFDAKFRAAYRFDADNRGRLAYRDVMIWAQAVAAAGATDGLAVAQALRSGTFHVMGVEASFDAKGDVRGPLAVASLWVWHDGRFVPLPSGSRAEVKDKP